MEKEPILENTKLIISTAIIQIYRKKSNLFLSEPKGTQLAPKVTKDSVRATDAVSNRSMLVNAFEGFCSYRPGQLEAGLPFLMKPFFFM